MGLRQWPLFFFLSVLIFSLITGSCHGDSFPSKLTRFEYGFGSALGLVESFKRDGSKGEGQTVFESDKRKVHTGPNPLHNR
ncbi:hypothetical protein AMTRI_Chr01g127420 [Amborella trichopoda]